MMTAKLSLMGLYEYDGTIFDNFNLPAGLDREDLITNLLVDLADLEILYPNPFLMKRIIGTWSKTRLASWERIKTALDAEYNPIHNYDRLEEFTDKLSERGSTNNTSASSVDSSTDNFVNGFNIEAGLTQSSKDAGKTSGSDTFDGTVNNDRESSHSGHISGNIGVTTSQQMIEAELELRRHDLYEIIVNEFKHKFCVLVY